MRGVGDPVPLCVRGWAGFPWLGESSRAGEKGRESKRKRKEAFGEGWLLLAVCASAFV